MKKILAMLLCVIMVISMAAMVSADEVTATQVTDSVAVGDQIVLVNIAGTHAMGAQDGKKRTVVPVNAANGSLVVTADVVVLTVEAGASNGTVALKAPDGYLYYDAEVGGNAMHTKADKDAAASWIITITDGVASIMNAADNNRFLQYNFNTNQERFVCYKGTQENVVIYKLGASSQPVDPKPTEPKPTEPKPTEPATPSVKAESVATPAVDTAYKFGLEQNKLGQTLFFTGEMSGYYLAMTEDATQAVDVYVENVEGGQRIYFTKDGVKTYIDIVPRGEDQPGKVNVVLTEAPTCVYTWDADRKTFVATVDGADWYLGTYNTYNTISASKTSYIEDTAVIGVSQFPAGFYTVSVEQPDNTGDMIGIVIALLAVSGMGISVLKKEK